MFDADTFLAAYDLPRFRWQGKSYTGRRLGLVDAVQLQAAFDQVVDAAEAGVKLEDIQGMVLKVAEALAFVEDGTATPMDPALLLALPPVAIIPAVRDFLQAQGTMPAADPAPPPTPGSS